MPDEVVMKEEELVRKLEKVELPQIELAGHRSRLKLALLESDYLRKGREVTFMEATKAKAGEAIDVLWGRLVAEQPVWKVALATVLTVAVIASGIFVGPSLGPQKASPFPEGSMEVGGPQLTVEQKELALSILNADTGVQELLRRGAVIEPSLILPLEVGMTRIDSETGQTEEVVEIWAQAWIQVGDTQWSAQVDLVRGKVASLSR
jgi:hypothetical protein